MAISAPPDPNHQNGVTVIVLSKKIEKSDQIILLQLQTAPVDMNIIQV